MLSRTLNLLASALLLAHTVTAADPHIKYDACSDDMPCSDTGMFATFQNTDASWLGGRVSNSLIFHLPFIQLIADRSSRA
jgi:hypothetical protein